MNRNIPADMCAWRGFRSACSSARSFQNIKYPHGEALSPSVSRMCLVRLLTRLHECEYAGSSGSFVGRACRRDVCLTLLITCMLRLYRNHKIAMILIVYYNYECIPCIMIHNC